MHGAVHFAAVTLAAFGLACASRVDVRIDQRKDLAGFRTWNFLTSHSANVRAPDGDRLVLDAALTRLVERCLEERGFERVTERPDFYVSYFLEVWRQVVVTAETPAMESLFSMNDSASYEIQTTRRRVEIHEQGRLTIFFTDSDAQAVAWRGGFEGRFLGALSPHLPSAVANLLGQLPEPVAAGGDRLDAEAPAHADVSAECKAGI